MPSSSSRTKPALAAAAAGVEVVAGVDEVAAVEFHAEEVVVEFHVEEVVVEP